MDFSKNSLTQKYNPNKLNVLKLNFSVLPFSSGQTRYFAPLFSVSAFGTENVYFIQWSRGVWCALCSDFPEIS